MYAVHVVYTKFIFIILLLYMEDFETSDVGSENKELSKKERRELRRQERKARQARLGKKGGTRRILVWAGIAVGIVLVVYGIILGVSNKGDTSVTPSSADSITEKDWVKGDRTAQVIVVEYGDFQCPACRTYYPVLKSLAAEFSDKGVAVAFRHFPLRSHTNADESSWAAESAGLQGKFWEMHDMLFERQQSWSNVRNPKETFLLYAQELGLDMAKFEADYESDAVHTAVEQSFQGGLGAGVNSTPSFFINGTYIKNPASIEEFRSLITNAINTSS